MFESKRLVYKALEDADFDLFYELNSNEEVMKYAYLDRICSREEAFEAYKNILVSQQDFEKGTRYVARIKTSNMPIGIVDYDVVLHHANGGIFEIGYFLLPRFWGQGFAAEMGTAIIDYLFHNFPIHKVTASANAKNKKSESVMVKLGMTKEGELKKARYKDGQWDDEVKYGLLKEEWLSKNADAKFKL